MPYTIIGKWKVIVIIGVLAVFGGCVYLLLEPKIVSDSKADLVKIGAVSNQCSTFLDKYQERQDGGITRPGWVYCLKNKDQMQLIPSGETEINPVKPGQEFSLVINLRDQKLETFVKNKTDQVCVRIPGNLVKDNYSLVSPVKYVSYHDGNLATYFCFSSDSIRDNPIFNFKGTCSIDRQYPFLFSFYILEQGEFDSGRSIQAKLWKLTPFFSFVIPISK